MMVVEREARWRSWLLFALMVAVFFVPTWLLSVGFFLVAYVAFWEAEPDVPTVAQWSAGLFVAIVAASVGYWFLSRRDAKRRLLKVMQAQPPNRADRYHRRFVDIVDEMTVATGAPRLEPVVVPTIGLNAFAFSDMRGAGCIGVTEGALARLSRPQLEAVVAHEVAHVVSGDYVTVTAACLLVGIYSDVLEDLVSGNDSGAPWTSGSGGTSGSEVSLPAIIINTALMILNAAISRDRERAADMAAVRFTRDPISLAQALETMRRHPGGAGHIPFGLSALCIRPTDLLGGGAVARLAASHPPIESRIVELLRVAHVSYRDFMVQADSDEDALRLKEHAVAPPVGALASTASPASLPPASRCPSCGDGLVPVDYEGVDIRICCSCAGRLVPEDGVKRIVARREVRFAESQMRLADQVTLEGPERRRAARQSRGSGQRGGIPCPGCGRAMMRRHYDYDHAVEVDLCAACRLVWFERDELEALQVLFERQTD